LDMPKIDALADALDEFTGAVLVCHESRLISRVCYDEEE
jgi:ATPase subunit of ABC transporter with duplicated ATPase domains